MKLYTEEQVIEMLKSPFSNFTDEIIEYTLNTMKSIELPSDEEVETECMYSTVPTGFKQGAKWVIEKIKQQADEN